MILITFLFFKCLYLGNKIRHKTNHRYETKTIIAFFALAWS